MKILYWIKIFSLVSIPILLGGVIYYTYKLKLLSKKIEQIKAWLGINVIHESSSKSKRQWQNIEELLLEDYSSSWKLAIVKADGLIENFLKQLGFSGKNLDELIQSLKLKGYRNLNLLEGAHQVSKEILINKDYNISKNEARSVINIYKEFWQEIINQIS